MHSASDKPKRIFESVPFFEGDRIASFRLTERGTARSVSEGRDNRDVSDDAANQKLSMNEIEDLKARAEDGNAIVEALIENSETYERKTEFGQEKYLSKKVRKYCTTFSTLRPTTASICEVRPNGLDPETFPSADAVRLVRRKGQLHEGGRSLRHAFVGQRRRPSSSKRKRRQRGRTRVS